MLEKIINNIYKDLKKNITPGVSTLELNAIAEKHFKKYPNVVPGPSLYNFPGVICTSVNLIAAHGVPSEHTVLRDGDLIKIDISAGFKDSSLPHGASGFLDSCRTFMVGQVKPSLRALAKASEEVTRAACLYASPGMTTGQLGTFIEQESHKRGFLALPSLMGHGIGDHLHMAPDVPNFGFDGGEVLTEGLTIAIEPVLTVARSMGVIKLMDGWSLLGAGISAQTEHTVRIGKTINEILI